MRKAVYNLWMSVGKIMKSCVGTVQKEQLTHSQRLPVSDYTHILPMQYTAFMNTFFARFTDTERALYTSSTLPIKTTKYIKKEY